jgi:membrane fusion protein, multidrug efflux system
MIKYLRTLIYEFKRPSKKFLYWSGGVILFLIIILKFVGRQQENTVPSPILKVYAAPIKASSETIMIRASGVSKASRKINLLSETSGQIYRLHHKKGYILNTKDPIATIQLDDRTQQLKEAKAAYELAKENLTVIKKLAAENFRSELNLKTAQVEYASASSRLARIEKEIENTKISAPFRGVLGDVLLEEGSVVAPGMVVATLLNLDPILIQLYIPEKDYGRFNVNSKVQIVFSNKEKLDGVVSFISSIADPKTHMFLVEISAENSDFRIPEGVTAQVDIPTTEQKVHKINPSVLSIDPDGNMIVKVLNSENKVESYPVQLVQSKGDTIWVTGLPDETILINYGEHFVNVGDTVQWEASDKLKGPDNAK